MRTTIRAMAVFAAVMLCLGLGLAHSQFGSGSPPSTLNPPNSMPMPQIVPLSPAERHRKLLKDTATLVRLTAELQNELSQPGNGATAQSSAKKAAEIEKLAHSVKQQMKGNR